MNALTWWIAAGIGALALPGTAHAAADDWQVTVRCDAGATIVVVTNLTDDDGGVLVEGGAGGEVAAGQTVEFAGNDTGLQVTGVGPVEAGDGQVTVLALIPDSESSDVYNVAVCGAPDTVPETSPSTLTPATGLPATGTSRDLVALAAVALFAGLGVSMAARRT